MQLLSHRNDSHHPSRLVITMTHIVGINIMYGHQLPGGEWLTIEANALDTRCSLTLSIQQVII